MKYLILSLALIGSTAYADDNAAKAFATGFANGLNQALYGQQYTNNVQQVNVTHRQIPQYTEPTPHYDAIRADGTMGGYYFFNNTECTRFLRRSAGRFDDCVRVTE